MLTSQTPLEPERLFYFSFCSSAQIKLIQFSLFSTMFSSLLHCKFTKIQYCEMQRDVLYTGFPFVAIERRQVTNSVSVLQQLLRCCQKRRTKVNFWSHRLLKFILEHHLQKCMNGLENHLPISKASQLTWSYEHKLKFTLTGGQYICTSL